jgi:hypothetical protein
MAHADRARVKRNAAKTDLDDYDNERLEQLRIQTGDRQRAEFLRIALQSFLRLAELYPELKTPESLIDLVEHDIYRADLNRIIDEEKANQRVAV